MLSNNFIALIITFAAAIAWLRINDFAANRGKSRRTPNEDIVTYTGFE